VYFVDKNRFLHFFCKFNLTDYYSIVVLYIWFLNSWLAFYELSPQPSKAQGLEKA